MKYILYISLITLVTSFACENTGNHPPNESKNEVSVEATAVDSLGSTASIDPSPIFLNFTKELESKSWVSDTARINKVKLYNLQNVEIRLFDNTPFYDLKYSQTAVSAALRYNPSTDEKKADLAFSQAEQIWGYFYRDKDGESTISDGLIEQWIYPNTEKATVAFEHFQKYGNNIFFNTMPFFHQQEESIYIFHARAMLFSYEQKPLFEEFLSTQNE